MGYALLTAPCFVCGRVFASNPLRVPSYQNHPICRSCIERVNAERRAKGLEEWPVFNDAYDPVDEGEL